MAPFARLRDDGSQRLPPRVPAARCVRARRAAALGALPGGGDPLGGLPSPLRRPRHDRGSLGMLAPADGEHAEIRVIDGRTYVSPVADAAPRAGVACCRSASRRRWSCGSSSCPSRTRSGRRESSTAPSPRPAAPWRSCHQSPWHVPIRWFVLFDDERALAGRGRVRADATPYRTTTRRAMRRAEHAVRCLRRSDLGPISELIVDLHQWLVGIRSGVAVGARLRRRSATS